MTTETKDKPLKKFSYWISRSKINTRGDLRKRTRADIKSVIHKSEHGDPKKVTVGYRDTLDLITKLSGKATHDWEL